MHIHEGKPDSPNAPRFPKICSGGHKISCAIRLKLLRVPVLFTFPDNVSIVSIQCCAQTFENRFKRHRLGLSTDFYRLTERVCSRKEER